jgi:RHS repeat-associated protein
MGQNLVLSYFATSEGRVRYSAGTYTFEYFIRDHLGNVRVSFDGTGTTAVARQENSYYPFGMTLPGNNLPTSANNDLFNNGSEWQSDFSNLPDLYLTSNRNYDPELGRFISVDPIADANESISTYQYAGNNPIGFNDPSTPAPRCATLRRSQRKKSRKIRWKSHLLRLLLLPTRMGLRFREQTFWRSNPGPHLKC